ncbi:MAG: amino acid adenylation domain-containing protein, partial [Acutalibacteraceae bacterium]|nr:amino acid adenylation domain-containing protein [Acutalibacteraceae bacterium]
REYVAPRNKTEEIICNIFGEILGAEQVGINDGFFELGGHSLRATRLVNRIEAETGVRIPLKDVFVNTTPEQLAKLVVEAGESEYESIPKAEVKEYYPMSSTQKRMYLINQIDNTGIAYNMPFAVEFEDFDEQRFIQAVKDLIQRHEALRTSFEVVDGDLVQHIFENAEPDIEFIKANESDLDKLYHSFIRSFDLSCAPLLRIMVVYTGEKCAMVFYDMHHIISDGVSMSIIQSDMQRLYAGEKLIPLRVQYKDYSEWLNSIDMENHAKYWHSQFSDEIPVLNLPLDYPRPVRQQFDGGNYVLRTSLKLKTQIEQLASEYGVTEYMVMLSAFMIMLSKYSNQEDLIVGTPISGRVNADIESMVGVFINTLAMRGKPVADKKYLTFLQEIKEVCLGAYEHQIYPVEELIDSISIKRDFSRNPLFDVLFSLQNMERSVSVDESDDDIPLSDKDSISKFDLSFYVSSHSNGYQLTVEYSTALFKFESIENMAYHFIQLLDDITSFPNKKIGSLTAISENEKNKLTDIFNATQYIYPKNKTVVELFEEMVEKNSDTVAVVFENQTLTYKELNIRANAIAKRLRESDIQANDFVALLAERNLEMFVGIWGVIKSGAAYVPIDIGYPEDRIQYILDDCKPKAILCSDGSLTYDNIPVIELKQYEPVLENPEIIAEPEDLLYIIYTSGTTGRPKGVMIPNRSVVNYCSNNDGNVMSGVFSDGYHNIASVTNYTFDIFVTEIISSMLNGMTVYFANTQQQNDPQSFDSWLLENDIEIIQTTPSRMRMMMIDERYTKGLSKLKWILLGGEQVERELVKALRKYTDASLEVVYGPSETTVWSSSFVINDVNNITIGKPISNTQIYILNGCTLCGIGMVGELCIAGDGLAKGYLNRQELTEEKFVDNPYGTGKMYRTGDLARWLPNGNIEFLGRIDTQVKIHGHRIELGEIQNQMIELPEISDAAVIVRKNQNQETAIFAYYVSERPVPVEWIRNELRNTLPAYMIPTYMSQIERIPVNTSGKLNANVLPDITMTTNKIYIAPETEVECALCKTICEVLNTREVGMRDNFFELGGDSINAVRIVYALEQLGFIVTVREILMSTDLSDIASAMKLVEESLNEDEYSEEEESSEFTDSELDDLMDLFED